MAPLRGSLRAAWLEELAPSHFLTVTPAPIAPAATLLLLRGCGTRLEVLMLRREAALKFMGGMWVFPGGRVDPSDCTPTAAAQAAESPATEPGLRALDGSPLPDALALGLRIAACRETWEEAGILLARRRDGGSPDQRQLHALQAERERVTTPGAFTQRLAAAGLLLDVGRLVSWAHWITPSHERRRFDTRFFTAGMPEGQSASTDGRESTESSRGSRRRTPAAPPRAATCNSRLLPS